MRDSQDPRAWDGRISNVIKYNQLVFQYWDISRIIPSISPSIIIPFVVLYDSIYYSTFHIFFNLNSTFFDLLNMYNIPSTIPCVIPFIISLFYSTYKSIYYDVNCSIYSISFTPFCDNSPRHEVRSSFSNEVKELAGLHQAVFGCYWAGDFNREDGDQWISVDGHVAPIFGGPATMSAVGMGPG